MVERKFMLDTNILIAMFKGENGIQERLVHEGFGKCVVSDISLGELYVGAFKTGNLHMFKQIEFVRNNFTIINASTSYESYGKLRALLETVGRRVDDMDLFIASSAIDNNCLLVTDNGKHFNRIPNLDIRNWFEEHRR
ncbi:MAG: PIN domain-containing protein [Bacteroidales bacterium]|nr:PIN domain-containing protein [Bacteroidales bacterium]